MVVAAVVRRGGEARTTFSDVILGDLHSGLELVLGQIYYSHTMLFTCLVAKA